MSDANSNGMSPSAGFFVRIGCTVVAVYCFYLTFQLVRATVHSTDNPYSYAAQEAFAREQLAAQTVHTTHRAFKTPWPRFPGVKRQPSSGIWINGTPFITEAFLTKAKPEEVTGFFRKRMHQQGWRDVTEKYFRLQPDALNCSGMPQNLQDEEYLRNYDSTLRSYLTLERGQRSIQLRVQPAEEPGQYQVLLTQAGKKDLAQLVGELGHNLSKAQRSRSGKQWVQTDQVLGRDRYSTRILSSAMKPNRYFNTLVSQLHRAGWESMKIKPASVKVTRRNSHFAVMGRGADFAMVLVSKSPGAKGSSAMVTTVVDK